MRGNAEGATVSRHARKVDLGHAAIRDALRHVPGMIVEDIHALPTGIGDLFVYRPSTERWAFVEIKSKGGRLTELEEAARDKFGEHWLLAWDVDDVLEYFDLLA